MTDEEIAVYCGIQNELRKDKIIASFSPAKRATIERMAEVETEVALWQAGLGPKPGGVILCHEHKRRRA